MLRLISLIAVSVAAAQPALAAPQKDYGEGAGERFEYTTELRANGLIHIEGVLLGSGKAFALDVTPNGRVDGTFDRVPVEYQVSKKVRDAVVAQLDQSPTMAEVSLAK